LALGVLLIGVMGDWLISGPTVIPLCGAVSQSTPGSGWDWVIFSFVLLAAGAVVSIWKGRSTALSVAPKPGIYDLTRLAMTRAANESDGSMPDGTDGLAEDPDRPPE